MTAKPGQCPASVRSQGDLGDSEKQCCTPLTSAPGDDARIHGIGKLWRKCVCIDSEG
jgi:hypothetical protein